MSESCEYPCCTVEGEVPTIMEELAEIYMPIIRGDNMPLYRDFVKDEDEQAETS